MSKYSALTAEVMAACDLLKQHGLYAAAKLLAAKERAERKPKAKRKRQAFLSNPLTGKRMSGSEFGVDLAAGEVVDEKP